MLTADQKQKIFKRNAIKNFNASMRLEGIEIDEGREKQILRLPIKERIAQLKAEYAGQIRG